MANTKAGGKSLIATMIKKYGSYEAFCDFMRENGSKGGSAQHTKPKGFAAMTPERHRRVSARGGRISRRGKAITI